MAVSLERAHAEFVSQGEGLTVVAFGLRALEAVHRVHHDLQGGIEELLGGLRIEATDQFRRVFEIGEEHGDLLALAFEGSL